MAVAALGLCALPTRRRHGAGRRRVALGGLDHVVDTISVEHLIQAAYLFGHGLRGSCGFFDERGVLLCQLVHLHDRAVDLLDAG